MNYSQKSFCILNSDPTFCKNPMWHFYGHKSTFKVLALLYKLINYLISFQAEFVSSVIPPPIIVHRCYTELLILWITMILFFSPT